MRIRVITFFLLLSCSYSTSAQNNITDSLSYLLSKDKKDTDRVILMANLARVYVTSKPDTAHLIAREAFLLVQKINYKKGEAISLGVTGQAFMITGNYPAALTNFLQALKLDEEIQDDKEMASTMGLIADVYFYMGDMKRSIKYSRKGLVILYELNDSVSIQTLAGNLGDTYEKMNQLDSALMYTRQAYAIAMSKTATGNTGIVIGNLGNIFRKLGKTDSAIILYRSALVYLQKFKLNDGLSEAYTGMAKIFLQQNKPDSALYYGKQAYAIAKAGGFIEKLFSASSFLADYYKSVRNIDSAFAYQAAAIEAKDSLFSQQNINQLQRITSDEALRLQQIDEAKEQERVKARQNAMIGGLAGLLIVAFLLIRNNRQRRKANVQLQKQKEEIDQKAQQLSVQKDDLERSYNNVEQLGQIGRKVTASLNVKQIIGTVYENVNQLMDASVFGIGLYNAKTQQLEYPATYENGDVLPFYTNSLHDENRFGVVCFNKDKEITIGNLGEEYKDHIQEISTPHEGGQAESIIFLPLAAKGKKLGVITVQSFEKHAYTDYHLYMLRNIANYSAIAIDNAESYETLHNTLSQLKDTQKQLIQSEKMASLGELTAGIAHEIQNPLNFVNNFSEVNKEMLEELKAERLKPTAERDDTLEEELINDVIDNEQKINHHGKRADAIVKGMLQHSRKSAGAKEPTDINALCDEYLRLSYHGLRAKDKTFNAEIKTDFDKNIGKVNIIPQDIGRVLLNLFNNAFYAVNDASASSAPDYQPTVSISTKKVNDKVEISVKDNGNGIPQDIVDKIFQPFFTTKPSGQGTGLGLSLSYDIIKAHGGEIKVETTEGEGSTFIIRLPAN